MKQIDNRQKKQVQMKAAGAPPKHGLFGGHRKEKERIPEPPSKDSDAPPAVPVPPAPVISEPRVGRNDPCSCGSGRKFKKCCLLKPPQGEVPQPNTKQG